MSKKTVVILPETQRILERMGDQIKTARLRRNLRQNWLQNERGSVAPPYGRSKSRRPCKSESIRAMLHALGGMDKDLELVAKDDELGRKLQDLNLVTPKKQAKGIRKWKYSVYEKLSDIES